MASWYFFRRRSVRWLAAGLCVAVAIGLCYEFFRPTDAVNSPILDPEISEPQVVFESPFRNTKPGIGYVGDAACTACHQDVAKSFHAHPMGRSADWVGHASPIERYDEAAKISFTALGFDFRVEKMGDRVIHRLSAKTAGEGELPDYALSAHIAIGSGTQGRTYLTVEKGAIWQSPISWYSQAGRWDLSPLHELDDGGRKPIVPGCLYCHTNQVAPVGGSINRYREPVFAGQVSIGCERCHGPGELHIAERRAGHDSAGIDYTIVNPKHLPADLKTDICRQCHLQGRDRIARREKDIFDYRPGLPWDQFVTTFVVRPDLANFSQAVGQFEQMEVSKCFAGSEGRLGCVTCHNPHVKPESKDMVKFYSNRCMTCHESKGCSAPPPDRSAKADSCIACHMPAKKSSNVAHVSITDHRIPRQPGTEPKKSAIPGTDPPLIPYPPGPHAPSRAERDRDWGIAAGNAARSVPQARAMWSFAENNLLASVAKWPSDEEAWVSLSTARMIGGNRRGAEEAAREAVRLSPQSESALFRLAAEARNAGDLETALAATNALVAMSPTTISHWLARAEVYVRKKDWVKAEADAHAALAIQPLNGRARLYVAVCLHHRGEPARALEEAATAFQLIPAARLRENYSNWFKDQIGATGGK